MKLTDEWYSDLIVSPINPQACMSLAASCHQGATMGECDWLNNSECSYAQTWQLKPQLQSNLRLNLFDGVTWESSTPATVARRSRCSRWSRSLVWTSSTFKDPLSLHRKYSWLLTHSCGCSSNEPNRWTAVIFMWYQSNEHIYMHLRSYGSV